LHEVHTNMDTSVSLWEHGVHAVKHVRQVKWARVLPHEAGNVPNGAVVQLPGNIIKEPHDVVGPFVLPVAHVDVLLSEPLEQEDKELSLPLLQHEEHSGEFAASELGTVRAVVRELALQVDFAYPSKSVTGCCPVFRVGIAHRHTNVGGIRGHELAHQFVCRANLASP